MIERKAEFECTVLEFLDPLSENRGRRCGGGSAK